MSIRLTWHVEPLADAGPVLWRASLQQPADLARQHKFVARLGAQERVEPRLRQPEPVERRRVVVAHTARPCGLQDRLRVAVRHGAKEVAERRRAETKLGKAQPAIAESVPVPNVQRHLFLHSPNSQAMVRQSAFASKRNAA